MACDRGISTITIAAEASSQGALGQEAVAAVILNRVKDGRWGKTAAAVCLKRMQFSEWNGDAIDNANLERVASMDDNSITLAWAARAYDMALAGSDPTGGCMWYKRVGSFASWAVGKTPKIVIGDHEFYNDIDS